MVTLIPKTEGATFIKDYRPIVGCTIVNKIISKVLKPRLGKVIGSIMGSCQDAFIPGK